MPDITVRPVKVTDLPPDDAQTRANPRPSRKVMGIALAIAAVSDVLGFWAELVLPVQWALDLATAIALFVILGRRWAILPGLIAEAIPGMGVFPAWILVVLSIILYDDIKKRRS